MIDWIIGVGGIVLGSGATGLIQFFCSRNDYRNGIIRKDLGTIIQKLSSIETALNRVINELNDKLYVLDELFDSYNLYLRKHIEQLKRFNAEENSLYQKSKQYLCEHAHSCPNCVKGDLPNEFDDLIERIERSENTFEQHQSEFRAKCLSILDSVVSELCGYSNFIGQIPAVYTLPKKIFKRIYQSLLNVEKANKLILLKISTIRQSPEEIGDIHNNLKQPILNALQLIEYAKIRISNIIEEML